MTNQAEAKVSQFYNTLGWETEDGHTEDARRWEDLRAHAQDYVSKCRRRVLEHIPASGTNLLDMASGPIQYPEYLEYSRNFEKRYCVDLSAQALESARKKVGDHGVFLPGSFFDIPLDDDFFDCAISLHTIYHIDKDRQEEAVRKLLRVTKPGQPVIIVYSNPHTFIVALKSSLPVRLLRRRRRHPNQHKDNAGKADDGVLYFHAHPIDWWNRFNDVASVKIVPWRSFRSEHQKRLVPNNRIGHEMFAMLFALEQRFPNFFVKHFQYPMIILTKKA